MAKTEFIPVSHQAVSEHTESTSMTFEQMYATYHDQLLRYMKFKYSNIPEAEHEETLQDAMIKAMTHFDDYVNPGHERDREGWIYTIVSRTAIDRLRFNNRRLSVPSSDMLVFENHADPSADVDFDSIYSNESVKSALFHVASVLTDSEIKNGWFEIFKLYAIEDKNDREISEQLDINKTTVRTRIFKLRKRLADNATLHDMLAGHSPEA